MKGKAIYIVDDDEDDRFLLRQAISDLNENIICIEIKSGCELLNQIQTLAFPSLIICDMNMPKMNGLETIMAIRSNPAFANVPAVMLSTSNNSHLKESAARAGFTCFYPKPSSVLELNNLTFQLISAYFS